jgi:hypothetical protein
LFGIANTIFSLVDNDDGGGISMREATLNQLLAKQKTGTKKRKPVLF